MSIKTKLPNLFQPSTWTYPWSKKSINLLSISHFRPKPIQILHRRSLKYSNNAKTQFECDLHIRSIANVSTVKMDEFVFSGTAGRYREAYNYVTLSKLNNINSRNQNAIKKLQVYLDE